MAHPLVLQIRELFVAPPGRRLAIADAAQIEARILGWQAGQDDLVAGFKAQDADPKAETDVYTRFASDVLGMIVRKPRKSDPPPVAARFKWARQALGKVGVLGCGYGMGPDKAVDYAQGAIDLPMAEKLVETYRRQNQKIVEFWGLLGRAFAYTGKYGHPTEVRGLRIETRAPDCDVIITLHNGRELKYHHCRFADGQIQVYNQLERHWEHTWGGALTENVIQALARDVLVEAMLRAEDRGVHTALSVHDELVAVAPIDGAEKALAILIEELSRPPVWGTGMPLAAEGKVSDRYGGH